MAREKVTMFIDIAMNKWKPVPRRIASDLVFRNQSVKGRTSSKRTVRTESAIKVFGLNKNSIDVNRKCSGKGAPMILHALPSTKDVPMK